FADFAERRALEESGAYPAAALDGRRTVRRRIGFYGNAQRHDVLAIEVEAIRPDVGGTRLLLHHRIRRRADDRLIAVSSAEKLLGACAVPRPSAGPSRWPSSMRPSSQAW